MFWGYNEKTIFEELDKVLKCWKQEDFVLVIRPHPKEGIDYWTQRIETITDYKVIIDKGTPVQVVLNSADIIVSMISMILIEACLINKPIISVQIGLNKDDPFYLSQIGVTKTILNRSELADALSDFFDNKLQGINLQSDICATRNILTVLEDNLWQN